MLLLPLLLHDFGGDLPVGEVEARLDGPVPDDNPFQGAGVRREIWSMGHRNAQGMAVHPETGELWIVEHGPLGGDGLNLVVGGANYGWPLVTHGTEYDGMPVGEGLSSLLGLEAPVHVFPPRTAPSGLIVYDGRAFPAWRGSFFLGVGANTVGWPWVSPRPRMAGVPRRISPSPDRPTPPDEAPFPPLG